MTGLELPPTANLNSDLEDELTATAHWSDDPPARLEEQEFDLMAFELWHLGSCPDLTEIEEWPEEECCVGGRASCL